MTRNRFWELQGYEQARAILREAHRIASGSGAPNHIGG